MSSSRQESRGPALPPKLRGRLALPRRIARGERVRLFLAGGAVRDLLLERPVVDLDLVVEGDAILFARRLAVETRAPVRVHERFATATLELSDGSRLDVATSRREFYDRPGALPRIEPAPIEEDLARRDFTINAMALELAPGRALLDAHGGRRDLASGLVRMLHPRSPHDDPTRAFRAVRYANRLGFRIEAETARWITRAARAGDFAAVSGDRLRREVRLLLTEERRAKAVRLMGALGLAEALHPALRSDRRTLNRLARAEAVANRHPAKTGWVSFLLVWSAELSPQEAARLSDRLRLDRRTGALLRAWPAKVKRIAAGGAPWPSEARPSPDEIAAAAALSARARQRHRFERALEEPLAELTIGGRDLLRAGVPSGPEIGRVLARTYSALRRGAIGPGEELSFALRVARGEVG